MFGIAVLCLGAAVFWELYTPDPIIDLRLLKVRNFAIASVFHFVFGVGLFASTTMIPQMLQALFGYRAIDAGFVLGPGAFLITLLSPVGAQLVQRRIVNPRVMLFGAFTVVGLAFLNFSSMNLATDLYSAKTHALRIEMTPRWSDIGSGIRAHPVQSRVSASLQSSTKTGYS